MAEKMISRADAAILKAKIDRMVDTLEGDGYDRGTVGAALMGIGAGIRAVHDGVEETLKGVEMVKAALMNPADRRN